MSAGALPPWVLALARPSSRFSVEPDHQAVAGRFGHLGPRTFRGRRDTGRSGRDPTEHPGLNDGTGSRVQQYPFQLDVSRDNHGHSADPVAHNLAKSRRGRSGDPTFSRKRLTNTPVM